MLMKMLLTLGSETRISNAFLTVSGVAPLQHVHQVWSTDECKSNVPSDIEEVRRVTTVERKDIHGGHGETGTVYEAPDAAI